MIYKLLLVIAAILISHPVAESKTNEPKNLAVVSAVSKVEAAYQTLNANNFKMPKRESFFAALEGFYKLKEKGLISKDYLTVVDFTLPSSQKRLWIIDLTTNTILFHSLVAHGRNTGENMATRFSNAAESYQSSLGLYLTGEVYYGKHGKSLKLDGMERGINDNARNRAVVIHGADYVSESFIRTHNRLGRSHGCPAIPVELTDAIIKTIQGKSCLYIYHPSHAKPTSAFKA